MMSQLYWPVKFPSNSEQCSSVCCFDVTYSSRNMNTFSSISHLISVTIMIKRRIKQNENGCSCQLLQSTVPTRKAFTLDLYVIEIMLIK